MIMMQPMKYEFLIREVFRCGRTMRYGADANIFFILKSLIISYIQII